METRSKVSMSSAILFDQASQFVVDLLSLNNNEGAT